MNYLKCLEEREWEQTWECWLVCLLVLFVVVVVVLIMISCHFTPLLQCVNTSCVGAIQQWIEWLKKFHRCYIYFSTISKFEPGWASCHCRGRRHRRRVGWWEISKRRDAQSWRVVSIAGRPAFAGAMCPSASAAQWVPLTCGLGVSAANRSDFEMTSFILNAKKKKKGPL